MQVLIASVRQDADLQPARIEFNLPCKAMVVDVVIALPLTCLAIAVAATLICRRRCPPQVSGKIDESWSVAQLFPRGLQILRDVAKLHRATAGTEGGPRDVHDAGDAEPQQDSAASHILSQPLTAHACAAASSEVDAASAHTLPLPAAAGALTLFPDAALAGDGEPPQDLTAPGTESPSLAAPSREPAPPEQAVAEGDGGSASALPVLLATGAAAPAHDEELATPGELACEYESCCGPIPLESDAGTCSPSQQPAPEGVGVPLPGTDPSFGDASAETEGAERDAAPSASPESKAASCCSVAESEGEDVFEKNVAMEAAAVGVDTLEAIATVAEDAVADAASKASDALEEEAGAAVYVVDEPSEAAAPVVIYTPRASASRLAARSLQIAAREDVVDEGDRHEADDSKSTEALASAESASDGAGSAESVNTSDSEGDAEPRWRLDVYPRCRPAIEIPDDDTSGTEDNDSATESACGMLATPGGATSSASTYVGGGVLSPENRLVTAVSDTVDAAARGPTGGAAPAPHSRRKLEEHGVPSAFRHDNSTEPVSRPSGAPAAAAAGDLDFHPRSPDASRGQLLSGGLDSPSGLFSSGSRSHPYPQAALSPALATRVGAERAAAARASAAALAARSVRIGVAAARTVQEDLGKGFPSPRPGTVPPHSVAGVRCRMSAAAAVRAVAERAKSMKGVPGGNGAFAGPVLPGSEVDGRHPSSWN